MPGAPEGPHTYTGIKGDGTPVTINVPAQPAIDAPVTTASASKTPPSSGTAPVSGLGDHDGRAFTNAAPMFSTSADYTAEQRTADLATVWNYLHPSVQGPRDYNAYHAAEQRLDNHYVGGLAVPGVEAPVVRTGPGYSGLQAVEDLYTSGLTGDLTPYQTEQRRQAMDRLKPYFYTVDAQHRDQVFAQWATPELCLVPGATAPPSYDPPDREKLIQQLVADGIPNGNPRPTWKQADAYVTAQTNDALARLNSAGIAIDPGVAQRYMDQPMATDPHYPNRLEPLLHVNLPSDDHLVGAFEKAFGDNVGSIPSMLGVDGLSQMGQSWKDVGLATESVLSVAPVTSAWMGWLADANGGHLPGMSKPDQQYQIVGDMAAGLTGWNQFRHGDIQAGIGTAFGNLTGGIVAGAVTGAVTDGVAGTVIGAARAAAGAGILDSATADSAITAASQAITRTRNGLADAIQPDPYTLDHTRGPGHATPKPDDPDSIRQRIANAIRPDHTPDEAPSRYDRDKLQQWFADHGIGSSDIEPAWHGPEDAEPWYDAPEDTPEGHWPVGVKARDDGQWYRPRGENYPGLGTVLMPDWAKAPTDIEMRGKFLDKNGKPLPSGDPEDPKFDQVLWKLNMVDDAQTAAKSARDTAEADLDSYLGQKKFRIDLGGGQTREIDLDDLSQSSISKTLRNLRNSDRNYNFDDIDELEILAQNYCTERGSVSQLSEIRGEIGGDYYANENKIRIIYRGRGPNDADALGIITDQYGNEHVVELELKGGDKPNSFSARTVPWDGKDIKVEQGTLPYLQDELRDGSSALQALREYNSELADKVLNGEVPVQYRLIHTEPGTHKITVYEFDPGEAGEFRLQPRNPGPDPTPPPTTGATPIAAAVPYLPAVPGLADLLGPSLTVASAGLSALVLPLLHPPTLPMARITTAKPIDQSLAVNITTRPASSATINRENARVMAYGAHIK